MILKEETSLTDLQYTALQVAVDDPSVQVTLRQYTPAFSLHDSDGHTSVIDQFDALVCDQALIRVYRSAADTLTVDRLQSEDSGDHSWSTQNLVATSISATVPPSLYAQPRGGDNDVRVFWYDGTNIKYFESLDEGVTWGAAQQVGVVANVTFLAATDLERVHYTTTTTRGNTRFHVYHENGGWSVTSSEIYWPYVPSSFDAVPGNQLDDGANWENDIIAFTTFFPPIVGLKVMGTEVYNTLTEVQGIAFIRYQNGRWSDHWTFDVVDKAPAFPSRYGIKLFVSSMGWIFLCYERYDGTENYGHYATAISRSKTGLEWELPYLLTRDLDEPFVLLVNGNKTYLVNFQYTHRSLTCGYTGTEMVTQDIEDNVVSLNVQMGDIAQLTMRVANPEQELDSTTPFSNDAVLDAVVKLGYKVNGEDLKIQTLLADIDTIDGEVALPTDHVTITGRDYLARLLTVQADQPNEWESQAIGGDNFQSGEDATDYSGLRHTAVQEGFFTAPNGTNSLALAASEAPGVAFSTLVRDAWNGSIQSGIYVQSDDYEDWVGLVFRAYDKKNYMSVRWATRDDRLCLVDTRDGEGETLVTKIGLGWAEQTWYYLKVRFRYSYVWVYTSTDGVEWAELFTKELDGASSTPAWTWAAWIAGTVPALSGRMGYVGYGFSEYDEDDGYNYDEWPTLPDPLPVEPAPAEQGWNGRIMISTIDGVFVSDDLEATAPIWYGANSGIAAGAERCWMIKRDPWHWWTSEGTERTLWGVFGTTYKQGEYLYKHENFPDGTWVLSYTALGYRPNISDFQGSIELEDTWYLIRYAMTWGINAGTLYVEKTIDGGDSWVYLKALGPIAQDAVWPNTWNRLAIAQHSGALTQHVTASSLHSWKPGQRTYNGWSSSVLDYQYPLMATALSVPYHSISWDDSVVLCTSGGAKRSEDGGDTWSTTNPIGHTPIAMQAFDKDIITAMCSDGTVQLTVDGGASWTTWYSTGFAGTWSRSIVVNYSDAGVPEMVFAHSVTQGKFYLITSSACTDKTGNLYTVSPSLDYVTRIERDSMGIA